MYSRQAHIVTIKSRVVCKPTTGVQTPENQVAESEQELLLIKN